MKKIKGLIKRLIYILSLKLKSKDNLDDWYYKRLEVCDKCPFSSKNKKERSFKKIVLNILSLNKPHCTLCGCTIKDKASGYFEDCPKGKWEKDEG